VTLFDQQVARLDAILPWARIVGELRGAWQPAEQLVHLRPSARGIRLVDLNSTRPQLACGLIERQRSAHAVFGRLIARAPGAEPARATPEKRLQSWLLAEAYQNDGRLVSLSPDLMLVTDEQKFPAEPKDFVCDLLAVDGTAPVVIELKSERQMARLLQQVRTAAEVVDAHRDRFAALFAAILGRAVLLDQPCEKWIVWPAVVGHEIDPRGEELGLVGVRVVAYTEVGAGYAFSVAAVP
jgi:hypothetical protein